MPKENLMNFIKRFLGKTPEGAEKSFINTGQTDKPIGETFETISEKSKPSFLNGLLLFFKGHKKATGVVFVLIIIGILIITIWQIFFLKPVVPARFTLQASISDTAGIDSKTSFILESTQSLTEEAAKKILKFNPEIEFNVKKISRAPALISAVFAQTQENKITITTFEIKPTQDLAEGEIYQAVITDPDYADREYSWAFQVKAPFQVIQTNPRNQGTYVPINSAIEITFNRENLISPQNYFEISPNVAGTFEQYGNILTFLPRQLAERTVYTVTIKSGLKSQGSNNVLTDDYTFAFETGEQRYAGERPYFNFENDFLEFIPDRKPTVGVSYFSINPNDLDINLYKFTNIDEFLNSYQNSRKWQLGWTKYYRDEAGNGFQPDENQKVLLFKPTVIEAGYQKFIEIPQVLEIGYYLLDVNIGGKHRQAWLQINPLSHYFSVTHDKSLLWMYDFQKKEPLIASKVSFYDKAVGKSTIGTTNNDGLIEFSTPDTLKEEKKDFPDPKFFEVEKDENSPLLIKISDSWGYIRKAGVGDLYWDYLSTDRYTYQMDDTVRYWGVAKGREQDLRQKKVKVGIYSGYYYFDSWRGSYSLGERQPLVAQEVLISQFDTIQGELAFKGISPGFYSIIVTIGDDVISTASIQILTYTKPAYQITVTSSKDAIFAGEKIDFYIKANFFDGTPVSELQLKYNGYWNKSISGELTLDSNGEGVFSYVPPYYESEYTYYPRSLQFTFSPKLSEEGDIWGQGSVLVFGPNIHLQSFQEGQSGDSYKFTAKLNHIVITGQTQGDSDYLGNEYIGDPVSGHSISAKVIKITYFKTETGQYYDPVNKVVRKTYRYDKKEEVIDELRGITDDKGEWSFIKTLPNEEGSVYEVTFLGEDSKGRKIESSSYAYFSSYNSWKEFTVSLNIGGESYSKQFSVGEKVKLETQILGGEKPINTKVLFTRYQNNIERVSIEPSLTFEETFERNFLPSVEYRAVILGPYGFEETNTVTASFREEDNNLKIDISPERENYRPGEEVKINLAVIDKDDKPVSAEVNVAIVDEALFHILPYNWQAKILETLYKDIYISPITGASQYAFLEREYGEGAELGACFGAGTKILMIDGSLKSIEKVKIGDQILTFKDVDNPSLVPAIVQGISQNLTDEYLIINDFLEVTQDHKMYVNGKWEYAGNIRIGDRLLNIDGSSQEVYSIKRKQTNNTLVYNILIGKYHTYFAGGYFVHNQEKGGGSPRANFVDVASYQTIHTDQKGKATVSFTTPDNITAWRTTAIAFSPDTLKAGQDVKLIKTSLPFFIDATLNNYYLSGDSPIIRLRIFGTDYRQNTPTEFSVKSDSLNLDKKEVSQNNTVYIPVAQLSEGEHEIFISAKQSSLQDSIVRKIKVVKSYFRKSESSIYDLSEDLSNIEGNKDGFTKLVFMDTGKGKFYRALWRHTYLEGIRSDQVAASFFGERLLAQYFNEPEPAEPLDLSSYHVSEGGISLFPYSDSDLELSVKMVDLAPEFIYREELKDYLNKTLTDKKSDIHRISKALYGLASLREKVLVKINLVKENKELTLEDKVYISLALAKLGDKESARKIYEQEIKSQLRFQGSEAWLSQEQDITKRVKLTGTIAVLASYLNIEKDADSLWNYIDTHDPERDLDVLEETLFIKSELMKSKDEKVQFSFATNARSDSVTLEKGSIYNLTLSSDELNTIKFSNIKGKISLVSFYERSRDPKELSRSNELNLTRRYFVNNRQTNSFNDGDIVLIRLDPNIAVSAIDGQYQVIDYLPSGLKPITRTYESGLSWGTECDPIWYPTKIIDNAVYFNISKEFDKTKNCNNRTINYYARVISRGSYTANPTVIQSLRDLDSLNVSLEDKVEVQ